MQDLSALRPCQTRSGRTYRAYALPSSFSLANALRQAVETESEGVEDGPRCVPDSNMGQPIAPASSLSAAGHALSAPTISTPATVLHCEREVRQPSCSVTMEEVVEDPPPSLKRKARSFGVQDAFFPRHRPGFDTSIHAKAAPNTPEPPTQAPAMSTPVDEGFAGDEDSGAEEGAEAQRTLSGKDKRRDRKKKYRANKRRAEREKAMRENTRQPRQKDVKLRVAEENVIPAGVDNHKLPADSSGYGATYANATDEKKEALDKEKLESEGYTVTEWDGREPILFQELDTKKLVVIAVGMPQDESYSAACNAVHKLFLRLGEENEWEEGYVDHKRGEDRAAVNMGVAYGFGNKPYNQANGGHEGVVEELLSSPELRRIAIHQSEALRFYAPRVYEYYHKRTRSFREGLYEPPFGFRAIHTLGDYDHTKGGHLVLKELKLIIQFLPGALILIPSATITHGNTPVRKGETRTSFTQYTAGALFRFVDNGFRSEKAFKKRDAKGYRRMQEEKTERWAMGLNLWSTVKDLVQRFERPSAVSSL